MRFHLLILTVFLYVIQGVAQNKQLLYGLQEVPQNLLINPGAKVTFKKHYGIPFLSQFHINGGSSGVTVFDIFGESNVDINTRIRNKIFDLENTDFFTATQQLNILDFGWKSKQDIYFSAGIYEELDFIAYFPKDLAILAFEGNRDYLGYNFNFNDVSVTADLLTVYHFGANKKISDKLTVGGRFKIYNSLFNVRSVNNSGTFTTSVVEGTNNIYEHNFNDIDVVVNTSGLIAYEDFEGSVVSKTASRAILSGNFGFGVDLGGTYDITEKLSASASILDLGAIFHTKDVENYSATGSYKLDGIELLFPPLDVNELTFDYYTDLDEEIQREIVRDTTAASYTQLRPTKLNGALTYSFGRPLGSGVCDCLNMDGSVTTNQSVGIQVYTIFRPRRPQMAVTAFYYRKLFRFLAAKATITADSYSYNNVGLAAVADIGKFNFYIAADNLLEYGNLAKANSISLQLGFNIKIDN